MEEATTRFFIALLFLSINITFCNCCIQSERQALVTFKQGFGDGVLGTWIGDGDCCTWSGVVCDNLTNHVLELNLRNSSSTSSTAAGKIIDPSLGELLSLKTLDLSHNKLSGSIPSSLGKLLFLTRLDLSENNLSGSIPSELGQLFSLTFLDLSNNELNGTLSEIHLANLTSLTIFYASGNSLMLRVSSSWVPPFQLRALYLDSWHLGPKFPSWILSQQNLSYLDISNTGISDTIPQWFSKSASQFIYLNFSHNQIHGEIPNFTEAPFRTSLDLSSNNLSGPLPLMSSGVTRLDLSNNALSGSISPFLCYGMNESKDMKILNLGDNFLTGEIPDDCLRNWRDLLVLILDNNRFTGNLPSTIGNLDLLESLHLRNNNFSGTIPDSLKNCTYLETLDLSQNQFSGNVPTWIGERSSSMIILSLRSNKFQGTLPMEICRLTSLQILDLSYNSLSGTIPRCINNFTAMATVDYDEDTRVYHFVDFTGGIIDDALLVLKGRGVVYNNTLRLVRIIDLSSNNFSGEIPTQVTDLGALLSLNFSHNSLTGIIPKSIGAMRSVESIDFSGNRLSGEIPQSISSLTFLSHLNLSSNNLTGKIPTSTQLQSFDVSSFSGNELCGSPLPKNCTMHVPVPGSDDEGGKDGSENEIDWFYVSLGLGFVVGFWSLIGPLLVNRRWRYMYCNFLDALEHKLFSIKRKCF